MNNQPHGFSQLRTKETRSPRGLLIVLTIGSLVVLSGCSTSSYCKQVLQPYTEMGSCLKTDLHARLEAQQLWRSKYAHCYGRLNNARDIRRGFIDGFVETANGGSGTAPIVPPEKYCGIGRKVQANCWYQGYPLGVAAAESTGAANWRKSTISPALAACFATPHCSPGCVPVPEACGCNTPGCNGSCGSVPASPMMQQPMVFDNHQNQMHNDQMHDDQMHKDQMHQPSGIQEPIRPMGQETVPEAPTEPLPTPKATPPKPTNLDDRPLQDLDINAPPRPSDAIERAIDKATDDVTSATSVSQPLVNTDTIFQVPSHRTPTVQSGPVEAPRLDLGAPETKIQQESKSVEHLGDSVLEKEGKPVVGGPIEMPNIQVGFDWMEPDWLFGEVDITRALLEQEIPSALSDQ